MEGHIDKRDMMLYVFDLLPEAKKREIDLHIDSCKSCLLAITSLEVKKHDACKKMESLFEKAYKDRLPDKYVRFWDNHIEFCNTCFNRYREFLEKKDKGYIDIFMGYISGLVEKVAESVTIPQYVLQAEEKKGISLDIEDMKTISRKGMDITLIKDRKGRTKAYLDSERYIVSGVTVSLLRRTGRGYELVGKAKTNKKGVANLGMLKGLRDGTKDTRYAIKIQDVIKK
ncbi:MAG: hypothetical protein N2745_11130 [Syntrophorhabdaceae bacterium]|nr:hypothetical protein [Syntrophorhabdaceae bacterium]